MVGDADGTAAGMVWNRRQWVWHADVNLLSDLYCVVDLDAEVRDCAFDLRMPEQKAVRR